jgi:23S rRNA pseudouridine1911/1915/1917 synthase
MNDQQWQVSSEEAGVRLDKWLAADARFGSRSRALEAIERGKVFLSDQEMTVSDAGRRLIAGETVRLWMNRPGSARRRAPIRKRDAELHIIYEDESLLVLNKPAGLLTVDPDEPDGTPSLESKVLAYLRPQGKRKPMVVHRIDRDTTGLVIFAKTAQAQNHLKEQFLNREPQRIYRAIVYGHPQPESGEWQNHLRWDDKFKTQRVTYPDHPLAKQAISRYRVLEKFAQTSLLEISLVTGKRHQIRVQAALRGHQLVGEKMYLSELQPKRLIEFHRQALHAFRLEFRHPLTGQLLRFEAPLPGGFALLLKQLKER